MILSGSYVAAMMAVCMEKGVALTEILLLHDDYNNDGL